MKPFNHLICPVKPFCFLFIWGMLIFQIVRSDLEKKKALSEKTFAFFHVYV